MSFTCANQSPAITVRCHRLHPAIDSGTRLTTRNLKVRQMARTSRYSACGIAAVIKGLLSCQSDRSAQSAALSPYKVWNRNATAASQSARLTIFDGGVVTNNRHHVSAIVIETTAPAQSNSVSALRSCDANWPNKPDALSSCRTIGSPRSRPKRERRCTNNRWGRQDTSSVGPKPSSMQGHSLDLSQRGLTTFHQCQRRFA